MSLISACDVEASSHQSVPEVTKGLTVTMMDKLTQAAESLAWWQFYMAHCKVWATWERTHDPLSPHCPNLVSNKGIISCLNRQPDIRPFVSKDYLYRVTSLCKVFSDFWIQQFNRVFFLTVREKKRLLINLSFSCQVLLNFSFIYWFRTDYVYHLAARSLPCWQNPQGLPLAWSFSSSVCDESSHSRIRIFQYPSAVCLALAAENQNLLQGVTETPGRE